MRLSGQAEHIRPQGADLEPGKVFAGSSQVRIDILGKSFRRHARVYVGNARVENKHVRFRSSSHLIVTLTGDLNKLLEKPDILRFQVVNPNDSDGVPSTNKGLSIVGPEITEASVEAMGEDGSQDDRGLSARSDMILRLRNRGSPGARRRPHTVSIAPSTGLARRLCGAPRPVLPARPARPT